MMYQQEYTETELGRDCAIDGALLKKGAAVLRAVNHPLRQQFLHLLQQPRTVTELFTALRIEQSVASQHLAILRQAGLVRAHRQGKFVFYGTDLQRLERVQALAGSMTGKELAVR
jgi:ArsR family transcriptional regulator, virulence genes transcriptional regulator